MVQYQFTIAHCRSLVKDVDSLAGLPAQEEVNLTSRQKLKISLVRKSLCSLGIMLGQALQLEVIFLAIRLTSHKSTSDYEVAP